VVVNQFYDGKSHVKTDNWAVRAWQKNDWSALRRDHQGHKSHWLLNSFTKKKNFLQCIFASLIHRALSDVSILSKPSSYEQYQTAENS